MIMITLRDVHASGMCSRGTKKFLSRHGYDVMTFIRVGVPDEFLIKTGDAMALRVVEVARSGR